MLALIIIGCVVLFLFLLLLVPIGGGAEYNSDGFKLWLTVACFRFSIYPEKSKETKPSKKKKKKHSASESEQAGESEQPQKPGELAWLLDLTRPALTALGQLRRKIKVHLIRVQYSIGGASDPADAAIQYGIASAGGGVLFPLLNAAFDVREWDVDLGVNFDEDDTQVALAAWGSWRLGALIPICFSLGRSALRAYRSHQTKEYATAAKAAKTKEDVQNGRKASDW